MSAHRMPQTFVAEIENDPDKLHAVVATVQFAHVTKFHPGVPHIRDDAIRHAETALHRDIYFNDEFERKLVELEFDCARACSHYGDAEAIRRKFAELRALKAPELPEPPRRDVVKPVQSVRFLTRVLLSTTGLPSQQRTDLRVHMEIVPVRDQMPMP